MLVTISICWCKQSMLFPSSLCSSRAVISSIHYSHLLSSSLCQYLLVYNILCLSQQSIQQQSAARLQSLVVSINLIAVYASLQQYLLVYSSQQQSLLAVSSSIDQIYLVSSSKCKSISSLCRSIPVSACSLQYYHQSHLLSSSICKTLAVTAGLQQSLLVPSSLCSSRAVTSVSSTLICSLAGTQDYRLVVCSHQQYLICSLAIYASLQKQYLLVYINL